MFPLYKCNFNKENASWDFRRSPSWALRLHKNAYSYPDPAGAGFTALLRFRSCYDYSRLVTRFSFAPGLNPYFAFASFIQNIQLTRDLILKKKKKLPILPCVEKLELVLSTAPRTRDNTDKDSRNRNYFGVLPECTRHI